MKHTIKFLMNKAKALISVFYVVLLWLTKLPTAIKFSKTWSSYLQDMKYSNKTSPPPSPPPPKYQSPSSSTYSSSPKPSPSTREISHTSIVMGDLIGSESGDYMTENGDIFEDRLPVKAKSCLHAARKGKGKRMIKFERTEREFPPPMTSLAGRGNWKCQKPLFFTREHVNDMLILRQKEVENYGYFKATRKNGRLALDLVLD